MQKNFYNNQDGRSMIEMLGVLAIVGVLSVAGIAGYSKAMFKYKINKLIDQVTNIQFNLKSYYSVNRSYKGLDTDTALDLSVFPEDMTKTAGKALHVFNGETLVTPITSASGIENGDIKITLKDLPDDAVIALNHSGLDMSNVEINPAGYTPIDYSQAFGGDSIYNPEYAYGEERHIEVNDKWYHPTQNSHGDWVWEDDEGQALNPSTDCPEDGCFVQFNMCHGGPCVG